MDNKFECEYYYNFKCYKVVITFKRMRNMAFRYDPTKELFKISAPKYTSKKKIFKYLEKFIPDLLKKTANIKPGMTDEYIYVFGNKLNLVKGEKNQLDEISLTYKNKETLNKYLKKILLTYIKNRIPYYYDLMNIKEYKISVKNMKTRLGSNSSYTRRLSFSLTLLHYRQEVIDSVIVHELSHDKYYDHSENFNNYLLSIFPNYKNCKKALNRTDYTYGINYQQNEQ